MAGGFTSSPARWRLLTTLLTGLLLLGGPALAVDPTPAATDPTVVTVPDVIFKERSVATAAILAAGLVPNVTETMSGGDPSPKLFGKVVGSTPRVGSKVAKGSTVELYVEATVVTVPDVIFKERSVATAAILAAGLVPNVTETMSGGDPSPKLFGKVVGSTPRVGSKVAKGSTVELYVEATVVTVPDVIFKERSVATAAILAAGLVPNVTETMSGGDPSPKLFGKVVGSTPRVGSKVAKGSTVELYVEATVVTVPDVIFKERSVATAAILAAGLVPNVTETMSGGDPSPKLFGKVVGSTPRVGSKVAKGSTVELYVEATVVTTSPPPSPVASSEPPTPSPAVQSPDALVPVTVEGTWTGTAQLVHTLFGLDPDEQGSSELVCTYTGRATLQVEGGIWSVTYSGQNWHDLDGAAFVCGGGSGEAYIAQGSYTLDPLMFTLENAGSCGLDTYAFDGKTLSGVMHAYCGQGDIYTFTATLGSTK